MANEGRRAPITLLDDSTRPRAPKIEGATPAQRRLGKRLAMIHDHHLEQIDQVRWVMEQVETGEQSAAKLVDAIFSLQMTANYRPFGNLCGRECQMLTLHHTIEDRHMFPALRHGSAGLKKVIDRLSLEHLIIHRLLEALEDNARKTVTQPGRETFLELKAAFLALERFVRSHFGYEQEELEEALGFYDVPL
ncbi:MAG: hemerythrin domain-containing protein [Xanthobacteraceae bacterium]